MTTPAGTPPWTRAADYTDYGGHLQKRNFQGEPLINPKTDVDASAIQRLAADLAAVSRMTPFAQLSFVSTGTTAVWVRTCRLMTGRITNSYAGTSPPTGFPTVTRIGAGIFAANFAGAHADPYSVYATFQPAFCGGNCTSQTAAIRTYASGTSSVYLEAVTIGTSPIDTGAFTLWAS